MSSSRSPSSTHTRSFPTYISYVTSTYYQVPGEPLGAPSDDFIQLVEEHIIPNQDSFKMTATASSSGGEVEMAAEVLSKYTRQFKAIFHHFEGQGSVTEKGGSFHINGKSMSVYQVTC